MAYPFVVNEKVNARTVHYAARHQPGDARGRQGSEQGMGRNQRQPAHQYIQHHRDDAGPASQGQFLDDAKHRQPPDHAEQRPTPGSVQRDQGKRRIAACDQQVNRRVIAFLQDRLGPAPRHVIQGRDTIKYHQHRPIQAEADDFPWVALVIGEPDQEHHADYCQDGAKQMCRAVQTFAGMQREAPG